MQGYLKYDMRKLTVFRTEEYGSQQVLPEAES